jgi:ParB family chromosome partitioning protein
MAYKVEEIEVEKIKVGDYASREDYDDEGMPELTASVGRLGVLNPLVCRRQDDNLVLVAGHRRLTAAKRAGLVRVPVRVSEDSESTAAEIAFAENLFRKDLSPVELASAIVDTLEQDAMTPEQLCKALRRSPHWLKQQVDMLKWPADVLQAVHEGWLSVSAASNVALVHEDRYRIFLLQHARQSGATARLTASWLAAWQGSMTAEQAIEQPPVEGTELQTPMVPQAPCLCCHEIYRTDMLAHVPLCQHCINRVSTMNSSPHR